MNTIPSNLIATDLQIAIVVSRFNEFLTERLLAGAIDTFQQHGGNPEKITIAKVPGAFEIPLIAKKLAKSKKYDAILGLGVVIRGATPHFDYVCSGVTSGLHSASLETEIPISFGIVTTDTMEQALERAGTKAGNQGRHACVTAIEMANLMKNI